MPSNHCAAYKKPMCWSGHQANGIYCDTCQITKDRDELHELVRTLPSSPLADADLLHMLNEPAIVRALLKGNLHSSLDSVLAALYARPSRSALRLYIHRIQATPLRATLLLRVRNHCRTGLCPVFGWMLRNGCFEDSFMPQKCLKCYTHMVRYGCPLRPDRIRLAAGQIASGMVQGQDMFTELLRATLTTLTDGVDRAVDFAYALRDSSIPEFSALAVRYETLLSQFISRPGFGFSQTQQVRTQHLLHQHTDFLRTHLQGTPGNLRSAATVFLKGRLDPWREELTAKTWHPSRFEHWCWSEDEKADMLDLEPAPPIVIPGRRADWHFRWG